VHKPRCCYEVPVEKKVPQVWSTKTSLEVGLTEDLALKSYSSL